MASAEVRVMEKIPRSSLICGKPIGQGGFGNVINGTHNGKDVAVKILHSPVRAESYIEFNFMFQLKHRNLARMIGLVDLPYTECPQLVFVKASRGNLLQYVQGMEEDVLEPLKQGMLNKFALDIIHGMEYLHKMHYFHKTLAARNILINQFGEYLNAAISDYGISRVIDGQGANYYKTEEGVTLPIRWIPNECIPSGNSTGGFQFASDVWSFGVVLWESWTKGDIPYGAARSNTEVRKLIISGSSPLTFFRPQCPGEVMGVMESIFREKPEERPSFTDLQKAFNQMKPKSQHSEKKTPLAEKEDGEARTDRPQQKGPKKPKKPQQVGDKANQQFNKGMSGDGGNIKGPKHQNQPGQNFPHQRPGPPNMHNPNQRPPNIHNPNFRPQNNQNPNFRPQNNQNPNFRPQNNQNPQNHPRNMQNPFQRLPNPSNPNQGQSGPKWKGRNNNGAQPQNPQGLPDAPPPYSPPIQNQPAPLLGYAGAPPVFAVPPQPQFGGNSEADVSKKMMELQQKISSLEVQQLEQKLQSLQKEVEGAKFQNKPKNPNQQYKKNPNQNKNPNQANQQHRPHPNPNKSPKHQGGQGNQQEKQGPSNLPDWMPAAGSAILGMAAGAAIAAAAMNSNSAQKNKKK